MAQWLNWGKGTSGSPNSISGTINTYATCTGTAGQTSLTTDLSASAGDQILIHQTQGTGAGTWEICEVVSDAGATLSLKTALVNSYGTGAQAVLIPQYTGGDISGAVTGTAWNGSVGGIVALMSNGDLTISGSINVKGSGFRGGTGVGPGGTANQGESSLGVGSASKLANGMGGGGAKAFDSGFVGGETGGIASLTSLFFGGAGGGAQGDPQTGKTGANSGGIILIFSKSLTISGTLSANGDNGVNGANNGASGGGAGGSVLIKTQSGILGTNKITASGGAGGTSSSSNGGNGAGGGYGTSGGNGSNGANPAGAGGAGRIRCDYFTSVSGSTTPTLSSAQDLTLNVTASSGFFNFF